MIETIQGATASAASKPRLGFLGVGWIGSNRLEAVARKGVCSVAAIADTNVELLDKSRSIAPEATVSDSFDKLLEQDLEGVVIATPSALHAEQSLAALKKGLNVFCQKPLGRTALEAVSVVDAARTADRLLAVDFSYRYIDGVDQIRTMVQSGELGEIFAVDLVFHNAYGPDKSWFFDKKLSGGGCLMDLGVHLVDLAFYILGRDTLPLDVSARAYSAGKRLRTTTEVEDFVSARLDLSSGTTMDLACSWNLHAGAEANISATFYGTKAGARIGNVGGSFFDFTAQRFSGTAADTIASSTGWDWGGRAIVNWAERLTRDPKYDAECESLVEVAETIDAIYAAAAR